MAPTERADRLAQLKLELAQARKNREYYDQVASEARDSSYEERAPSAQKAWMDHSMRLRGQAIGYANRVHELVKQIAELEGSAPVVLTAEQCSAVDDTMNFRAVAA